MFAVLSLLFLSSSVLADISPLSPGPDDTFNSGGDCTITWAVDTTGTWTNVSINLMAGPNNDNQIVANVISGLDGTDDSLTPFKWTCPDVDPNSAIYFYRITNGDDLMNSKWTTRFTIASPSGDTTPPEYPSQPDGSAIPWGTASLNSQSTEPSTTASADDDSGTSSSDSVTQISTDVSSTISTTQTSTDFSSTFTETPIPSTGSDFTTTDTMMRASRISSASSSLLTIGTQSSGISRSSTIARSSSTARPGTQVANGGVKRCADFAFAGFCPSVLLVAAMAM